MTDPTRRHQLTESELYLFDTTGFVVLRGFLDADVAAMLREEVPGLPARWMSKRRDKERFDDLAEHHSMFADLARSAGVTTAAASVINQPFRLVESYALRRTGASVFYLHNGHSEVLRYGGGRLARRNMSLGHTYHDGKLYCMLVKMLVYLTDVHTNTDGPFCYLQGSHKANFARFPDGLRDPRGPELTRANFPSLESVHVAAGDAILLNEALLHGTLPKSSVGERLVLAFSYAPSFVTDWHEIDIDGAPFGQLGHY